MPSNNIIGLDVGKKRVGVAIARGGSSIAFPVGTFPRANGEAERAILKAISDEGIKEAILGLPLSDDGTEGLQASDVRKFASRLSKRAKVKITFFDEYGSSIEAKQRLNMGDSPSPKLRRSGVIDAASASIVLQQYIDSLGD